MKFTQTKIRLGVAIALGLVIGAQMPVMAQSITERVKRLFGGGGGSSDRGRGGGTLDLCPYVEAPMLAFAPVGASLSESTAADRRDRADSTSLAAVGTTIQPQPTLWFYMPYGIEANRQVEFVLIDRDETILSRQQLSLPETPGVMPVSLSDQVMLTAGQRYRWVFSIICNPANRSADLTVNGWIERRQVPPQTETEITAALPHERPLLYAENELWYDTIDALARLRIAEPSDDELAANWLAVLEIVGLEQTAIEQGSMPMPPDASPAILPAE